eukprot:TRINITY_DN2620_c1_g1_i2.p1 TRINITY_DN2620_c1_g1~~TRINITY_DN2620_c1_g1_i2.p1  ORF type:complete len:984 (+),score=156.13 TRINITY_DN2620_c1_g1_i2:112-3063(+)
MPQRIIVVSNRLPVSIHPSREAPNDVEQSSGGLVSALRRVASTQAEELVWIGWPGCTTSSEAEEERLAKRLAQESLSIKLVPVWLTPTEVEDFYNGFSNSSLWPLLHWMTAYARFKRTWFESYTRVNKKFADVVLAVATPEDLIWVQDYHLFLLPQMLRQRSGEAKGETSVLLSPHMMAARPEHLPPPIEDEMPGSVGEQEAAGMDPPVRPLYLPSLAVPMAPSSAGPSPRRQGTSDCDSTCGRAQSDLSRVQSKTQAAREPLPNPTLKIAFFLHTPFPPYEVICVLPQCLDIVEGVLGADIVGFHTYSYLRHFRSCVVRLCGLTTEIDQIVHLGHRSRLDVFPIGANWQDITEAMETEQFSQHLQDYTKQYEGKSLVLSVERLDYSKGMPQKLAAIERYLTQAQLAKKRQMPGDEQEDDRSRTTLLEDLEKRFRERNSDHVPAFRRLGSNFKSLLRQFARTREEEILDHEKTVFIFIAVPSRQAVREYQEIEEEVHRSVSTINGRFSTPTHQPIVYIHRAVSVEELAALYARADCCLVTPLIDGMNLVAKEFVVAKNRSVPNVVPGTVVLSELAGAAQELFDSIVVNPYDEDAVANAIAVSLELTKGGNLDEDLRWEVTGRMRESVMLNDSVSWARMLLDQLKAIQPMLLPSPQAGVVQPLQDSAAESFYSCVPGTKALFLDYDGTLREFARRPEDAVPSAETLQLFALLNQREDLRVFIVSGRKQEFLEAHFHPFEQFTLVAEHGFVMRGPDTGYEWRPLNPFTSTDWMLKVMPIMQLYERCTPGSMIEEKCSAIVWHYRECDEEYGKFKAKELMHQLALSLGNLPCEISQGHKIIEVSSLQVKKGPIVKNACAAQTASGGAFVQILCVGDDSTDESMFLDAPQEALTVKVGDGETYARHSLRDPADVRRFLLIVAQECPSSPTFRDASVFKSCGDHRDTFKSCSELQGAGFKSFDVRMEATAEDADDDQDSDLDLPEFEH